MRASHAVILAALLVAGAVGIGAGPADAEPGPPPDPAPVGPPIEVPSPPADPFAAASAQTHSDQAGVLAELLGSGSGASPAELFDQGLGQSAPPPLDPLAAAGTLFAQNYRMPSGDEPSPYALQTDVPAGPFARIDVFRGVHALFHSGIGRMAGAELGQPLPGTAAPPGVTIPPGLEQFYVSAGSVSPVG